MLYGKLFAMASLFPTGGLWKGLRPRKIAKKVLANITNGVWFTFPLYSASNHPPRLYLTFFSPLPSSYQASLSHTVKLLSNTKHFPSDFFLFGASYVTFV